MEELSKREHSAASQAIIREALAPYGLSLNPAQSALIELYVSVLNLWNQRINLTSVVEPRQILERHFGESMFATQVVPIREGRLADVGSGAGFPGLALKIASPELQVTLIEANARKAAFLAEVRRQLHLQAVVILRSRIEDLPARSGSFDFVVARAIGGFDKLLKWSGVALVRGGRLVIWLGAGDAKETARHTGWAWRKPIPVPNSRRRVLLVGEPV